MQKTITIPVTITLDVPDNATVSAGTPVTPPIAPSNGLPTPPATDAGQSFWGYLIEAAQKLGRHQGNVSPMAATRAINNYQSAHPGVTDAATNTARWPAVVSEYFAWLDSIDKPQPTLAETYPSLGALVAACAGYPYAVTVDGAVVHDGFGPADHYHTHADGSVHNGRDVAPMPAPTPAPAPVQDVTIEQG